MNLLVDTNILVSLSDTNSPRHPVCDRALTRLIQRRDALFLCAQAMIEYRAAATRPRAVNGLGLSAVEAEIEFQDFERWGLWLDEPPDIGFRWRQLVNHHGIIGKRVHDTRLVALMEAHGLTTLLTSNTADFACYSHITCLLPSQVT